jgi:hypothetical protein
MADDTAPAPAASAAKGEWVDHAVAQGADPAAAEGMTKAQLQEQFGPQPEQPPAPRTPVTEGAVDDPAAMHQAPGQPATLTMSAAQHAAMVAAAENAGPAEPEADEPDPDPLPYAWVAAEDLYIGDPLASGVMRARAFRAGDMVPHQDVGRHGWRRQVRLPDDYQAAPADDTKEQ